MSHVLFSCNKAPDITKVELSPFKIDASIRNSIFNSYQFIPPSSNMFVIIQKSYDDEINYLIR